VTAEPTPARPSAALILLRDAGDGGLEVLLARRHERVAFHGGAWVFPGGRVEPGDHDASGDELGTARRAAVREVAEEVALAPAGILVPVAHWTTPASAPKRFATWFFAARAAAGSVVADGHEIAEARWLTADAALAEQAARAIELPPTVFVTLIALRAFRRVDEALAAFAARTPERFTPRPRTVPDGICSLYREDSAYEGGALDLPGPRHRLWMIASGWRYERSA
jgi:8-oxo-dGTP pyrophosphatase MutT (NUDIX family)